MSALSIGMTDREPVTFHDQRPSHPVKRRICLEYIGDNGPCPVHDDPRTDKEKELDRLDDEVRETVKSIRPGP
jgi:hypothetical protein